MGASQACWTVNHGSSEYLDYEPPFPTASNLFKANQQVNEKYASYKFLYEWHKLPESTQHHHARHFETSQAWVTKPHFHSYLVFPFPLNTTESERCHPKVPKP